MHAMNFIFHHVTFICVQNSYYFSFLNNTISNRKNYPNLRLTHFCKFWRVIPAVNLKMILRNQTSLLYWVKTFGINPLHEKLTLNFLTDIALSITYVYRPYSNPISSGVFLSKRVKCIRITEKRVVKSGTVEGTVVNFRGGTSLWRWSKLDRRRDFFSWLLAWFSLIVYWANTVL